MQAPAAPPRASRFVVTPASGDTALPVLQAFMPDGSCIAVHSARHPVDEAGRWAERLTADGSPVIVFGLGLRYHALAAASRPGAGRVIVVEPFVEVLRLARERREVREALDCGRLEVVAGWDDFKRLASTTLLDLGGAHFAPVPAYQRIADNDHAWFATLIQGAMTWARKGLDASCKPFFHPPGMSVVSAPSTA